MIAPLKNLLWDGELPLSNLCSVLPTNNGYSEMQMSTTELTVSWLINILYEANASTIWYGPPPKNYYPSTAIFPNKTLLSLAIQKLFSARYGWPLWNLPLVRPPTFQLAISLRVACTGFSLPKHVLGPPNPLLFHPGNQSNLVLKLLANHDNKLYQLLSGFPGALTHHQFLHPTHIRLTSPEQGIASIGKESR